MGNQINKPNTHFNPVIYTGNGASTQAITGVNFQPDFLWIKSRSAVEGHLLVDSIRGSTKRLQSQSTNAEDDQTTYGIQSFNSDGFTTGDGANNNASGYTYVGWNWLGGGTASSNSGGSITSSVSANTTAGFSIATYTGNGTSGSTIGHGLTSVPSMIITKRTDSANGWGVYHQSLGTGKELYLNYNFSQQSSNFWITTPTTSVFSVSSSDYVNLNNATYVAYCFAEKKGFSKMGSYIASYTSGQSTPNATGTPFVYTGFKPAFIMVKDSDVAGDWVIFDSGRSPKNPAYNMLFPNTNGVEISSEAIDIYSNGFKPRSNSGYFTTPAGSKFIFLAIAEQPLVGTNGVPATAR